MPSIPWTAKNHSCISPQIKGQEKALCFPAQLSSAQLSGPLPPNSRKSRHPSSCHVSNFPTPAVGSSFRWNGSNLSLLPLLLAALVTTSHRHGGVPTVDANLLRPFFAFAGSICTWKSETIPHNKGEDVQAWVGIGWRGPRFPERARRVYR
jgi:hypothetical protein